MNLRRGIILGLGIILLATIAGLILASRADSPTVKGRSLSKWLRSVGMMQVGEVAEAGTNAIPFLQRSVLAHDAIPYSWKAKVWRVLPQPLRSRIGPPVAASELRQRALLALRDFGPEAQSALDVVVEAASKDPNLMNQSFARQAAVAINVNDPGVRALLGRDLQSTNAIVRGSALGALWDAGVFPQTLTKFIVLDPHDRNQLYFNELLALGALGPELAPLVPRVTPFLSDHSTRGNGLSALQRAGPGAAAAVPELIACLSAPEPMARSKAAEILMGIGSPATEAVPALEAAMRDQELVTRVMAAAARWRITGDPAPSIPVILAALQATDSGGVWSLAQGQFGLHNWALNARQTALWFAGELGPLARESLPLLVQRMEAGPEWQRVVAARSVWKVEGSPARSLPVLKACLGSKEESVRILACYILGEIGASAAPLVPDLERAERTTLYTRRAAQEAIKAIQQAAGVKPP